MSILTKLWNNFGEYSASKLIDVTHSHSPWIDSYNNSDIKNSEIKKEIIASYYKSIFI